MGKRRHAAQDLRPASPARAGRAPVSAHYIPTFRKPVAPNSPKQALFRYIRPQSRHSLHTGSTRATFRTRDDETEIPKFYVGAPCPPSCVDGPGNLKTGRQQAGRRNNYTHQSCTSMSLIYVISAHGTCH